MDNNIVKYNQDTKIAGKEDIDVYLAAEYINPKHPIATISFPQATEYVQFYQTRETLMDVSRYKSFIDNCVSRFRKSRSYKGYKAYLMSLGMDRCQINGNIQDGMADIEMHHNFLTIFDITLLISQHLLNTVGRCTTFDVISLLIQEHRNNNIPIVMLSETSHQLYHDNPDVYIPISMTFGKWWELLYKYRYGITIEIAWKVVKYISNCQRNNELTDFSYYNLSNTIRSWGEYNDYNNYYGLSYNNAVIDSFDYGYGSNTQNNIESYGEQNPNRVVYSEAELFGGTV